MWGCRASMSPSAKLKRGWSPLVVCSTNDSRAPGTRQGCKEKYKQVGKINWIAGSGDILGAENVLHSSQESGRLPCTSQLFWKKSAVLSAEWRGGKLWMFGAGCNRLWLWWDRFVSRAWAAFPDSSPQGWSSEHGGVEVRERSRSPARPGAEEISKGSQLQHATTRWLPALCLALLCISIGLSELIRWTMSTICQANLQSVPHPPLVWRCWRLFPGACCNPACCCFAKSSS